MKVSSILKALVSSVCCLVLTGTGQNLTIDSFSIVGGGGTSAAGVFAVSGNVGPHDAGKMSGRNYSIDTGFWNIVAAIQTPGAPTLALTRSGNKVSLSWPVATDFLLERNNNLAALSGWENLPNGFETNKGVTSVMVSVAPGYNFFRLRKP